jgi:hypothetical protein
MSRDPQQLERRWQGASPGSFGSLLLVVVDERPLVRLGLARVAAAALGCCVVACEDLDRAAGELERRVGFLRSVLLLGLRTGQS